MSRAPFVLGKSESAYGREAKMFNSTIGPRFPNPKIAKGFGMDTMAETADNVAREHSISREESDRFALASQQKYARAKADGFYDKELLPVAVPSGKKGATATIDQDEHPRPDTTLERLAELKALNEGGVVTAGNASGINDGAAALIVGTKAAGEKAGVKPMARIVSAAVAGVPPRVMGLGPVPATQKALERAGLALKDMDVIELNEAFASQVLGCLKLLDITFDDARINPNGGAIAIGHPLGAWARGSLSPPFASSTAAAVATRSSPCASASAKASPASSRGSEYCVVERPQDGDAGMSDNLELDAALARSRTARWWLCRRITRVSPWKRRARSSAAA